MKDSIQQMEEQIQAMQEQLNQLKAQQAAMKSASTEPNHAQPAAKSEVPPTTSYPSWNTSPPPAAHQHSVYPAQTPHAHPIPPTYSWNPTPPPMPTKPKKEWDQLFAKKFMGILASGLILIGGLVLLALLAADWVKWILLTGIGSGLLAVGSIGARKQPAYLYFFHAISGLGAALLYVTILLLWKTYPTIPFPVFYGMLLLWTISLLLSIKQKNTLLPVISLIGMFFSVFIPYGFDRPTQSFMLAGLITIVSLLSIFLDTPAQRTITLLSLFFTEGSIACFLVRIWLLHTFRHTAFVSWIAAIALLTALLLTLTLWYAIRIDRPANHSTDCGLFLNLGNLILLFSGLLICMQLLKYTEAVMRPLVGTGLLLLFLLCLSASKKRDLPFQLSLAGCCILHLFLLLLHASPLTLSIWVTVASCLIGYGVLRRFPIFCTIGYLYSMVGSILILRQPVLADISFSTRIAIWMLILAGLQFAAFLSRTILWKRTSVLPVTILHFLLLAATLSFLQDADCSLPLRLLLSLAGIGYTLLWNDTCYKDLRAGKKDVSILFGVLSILTVVGILNAFLEQSLFVSIVCLLLAIGFILIGFLWKNSTIRQFGLIVTFISLFKLLVIDLVDLLSGEGITRAICCMISGVLCFLIHFIYSKFSASDSK